MNSILRSFKERRDNDEGFTLIELMVVVLIIGILLAIAVPTFLNAQNNAKSKAATSNLRSGLSAVKTVYADKQAYNSVVVGTSAIAIDKATLDAAEPSLGWVATADAVSAGPEAISWNGPDLTTMQLAVKSKLGDCFYVLDSVASTGGGTKYGKTANATTCKASDAATVATLTSPSAAGW